MSKSRSRTHSADIDQNQLHVAKKIQSNYIHIPKNENKILNRNFSNNYLRKSNNDNITKSLNNNNYIFSKGEYSCNASNNMKSRTKSNL